YITSIPYDYFNMRAGVNGGLFDYGADPGFGQWDLHYKAQGVGYFLVSVGPNLLYDVSLAGWPHADIAAGKEKAFYLLYDATNGTKSAGDIIATTEGIFNIQ
ncbi:MAG TPA: hypothetical protein VM492_07055, partial [Sumerlaeia bacterium]|nr:hypothetical protein [Sumerlaeia bacterium]